MFERVLNKLKNLEINVQNILGKYLGIATAPHRKHTLQVSYRIVDLKKSSQ